MFLELVRDPVPLEFEILLVLRDDTVPTGLDKTLFELPEEAGTEKDGICELLLKVELVFRR